MVRRFSFNLDAHASSADVMHQPRTCMNGERLTVRLVEHVDDGLRAYGSFTLPPIQYSHAGRALRGHWPSIAEIHGHTPQPRNFPSTCQENCFGSARTMSRDPRGSSLPQLETASLVPENAKHNCSSGKVFWARDRGTSPGRLDNLSAPGRLVRLSQLGPAVAASGRLLSRGPQVRILPRAPGGHGPLSRPGTGAHASRMGGEGRGWQKNARRGE